MAIAYKKTGSGWGLTALFEGYQLMFSGPTKKLGMAEKLQSLSRPGSVKKSGSIVASVDIYKLFSPSAKNAWVKAASLSKTQITAEDIFLALLKEKSVINLFDRMKVSRQAAETLLKNYRKLKPDANTAKVKTLPFEAFALSLKLHNHKIGSLMLLGAILRATPRDSILEAIFSNIGLSLEKLEVFAVLLLDLTYEFPQNSQGKKMLYCLRQAQALEEHFGYFFEAPAIELAVAASSQQTLQDLEHFKALQYLVKAAGLAKKQGIKVITADLVKLAAA